MSMTKYYITYFDWFDHPMQVLPVDKKAMQGIVSILFNINNR